MLVHLYALYHKVESGQVDFAENSIHLPNFILSTMQPLNLFESRNSSASLFLHTWTLNGKRLNMPSSISPVLIKFRTGLKAKLVSWKSFRKKRSGFSIWVPAMDGC